MVNVAICDDNIIFANKLESMLIKISKQECIAIDTDVFTNGRELLDCVNSNEVGFDLIFLDIEMKEINGLETARQLRKIDEFVLLIYVTCHESYAIEAYDVNPFQFMVKPIDLDKLRNYFIKAYERIIRYPEYYPFEYKKRKYRVSINDIMYFQSNRRIISIYMANGEVLQYYDKMGNVETKLKQGKIDFWRIHQSCLVNSYYIYSVSYDRVELKNHRSLFISEDRQKTISELYCNRIGDSMIE